MACDEGRKYLSPPISGDTANLPPVPGANNWAGLQGFLQQVKNVLEGQSTNPIRPGAIQNFTVSSTDSGTLLVWDPDKDSAFYALYRNSDNNFSQARVIATVHASGGAQRPGFFDVAGQDEVLSSRVYWVRGFSATGTPGPLSTQTITVDNGIIPGDRPWTETLTPGEVRLVEENNSDPVVIRSYGVSGPELRFQHLEGTSEAPTQTLSGDSLGRIEFRGFDGSLPAIGAVLEAVAADDVSGGSSFSASTSQLGGDSINGSWANTGQRRVSGIGIIGDYILVTTMSNLPDDGDTATPKVYRYQISTNTWTNVAPTFPSNTTFCSNVVVHNNLAYYGIAGNSSGAIANGARVYSYDPVTNTHTTIATQANLNYCNSIALDENNATLYVADATGSFTKLQKHVIGSGSWSTVSTLNHASIGTFEYVRARWHSDGFIYYSLCVNTVNPRRNRIYRYNISSGVLDAIGGYLIGGNLPAVTNVEGYPELIQFGPYLYVSTATGEIWEWNNNTSFWTQIGGDGLGSSWSTTSSCDGAISYNGYVYWSVTNGSGEAELWQFTPSSGGIISGTWAKVVNSPGTYEMFEVLAVNSATGIMYSGMGATKSADADFWGVGTAAGASVASTDVTLAINIGGTETVVATVFSNADIGLGIGSDGVYWDESTRRLGIRTTTPTRALDVGGTNGMHISQGTPATPALGDIFIAATTGILTWHDGTAARRTVHAPADLTTNALVKGSGGATGLQTTGINVSSVDAVTGVTLLGLEDTDGSHNLSLKWNENSAANHTLNILGLTTADRSLTFTADATIGGTNTGDVTLDGTPDYITITNQVITRGLIDLATDVTGDLPFANLAQASAASKLLGRGDSGAGDLQEISLGTGLTMTGTTLSASGSGGTVSVDAAGALDGDGSGGDPLAVRVDGVTVIINASNELEATGSGGAHASTHYSGGGDTVDITQLGGYDATATNFLDGTGAFDSVKDSDLSTSDITTNDVTTSKHGFVPKAPNDTTKFLRGDATWAAPSGGGWALAGSCMDTGTTATGSWDFTSNVTQVRFNNLGGYKELLIITKQITKGTSGTTQFQYSVDNGSTFLSGTGDYTSITEAGVEATATAISMHGTSATAARSTMVTIFNWDATNGISRIMFRNSLSLLTNPTYRLDSTSAADAIRIFPSGGGNITGGSIRIYAR